jgi:hypothetical protein
MKKKQVLPRFQHAGHFKRFWDIGNGKKLIILKTYKVFETL